MNKTGTIVAASGATITEQYCIKRNNIVSFKVIVKATEDFERWASLATLPEGFRPLQNIPLSNHFNGPSSYAFTMANILSGGGLQFDGKLLTNECYCFYGTFVIG